MLPEDKTAPEVQPQPTKPPERYEAIVPPFNWLPPEWIDKTRIPTLDHPCFTVKTQPTFDPAHLNCVTRLKDDLDGLRGRGGSYEDILKCVEADRYFEKKKNEEKGEVDPDDGAIILEKLPHPNDSFEHDEPAEYDEEVAPGSGRMSRSMDSRKPLEHPYGWPRLQLVFEHTLCKVTTVLGQINAALDDNKPEDYMAARRAYEELLRDLDNHEPSETQIDPGESGYGRSLKWFYVQPVIFSNRIYGVNVIAKWNPHFSSSGIPIPH